MKVLVADDDAVMAALLGDMMAEWGHDVTVVADGESAWQALLRGDIRLMVSDWEMPGCDGPELCRRLRSGAMPHYVYTILVTGLTADEDLVRGMAAGADDFVRKTPFSPDELHARVRAGERIVALEGELASRNTELESAIGVLRHDLEAAASVQKSLLPSDARITGKVEFSSMFCPSTHVSGDIFNVVPLSEHECGFYVIDVAGHGVPASLTAVSLSNILTREFLGGRGSNAVSDAVVGVERPSTDTVVAALNERFQAEHEGQRYFTMVYGVLNSQTSTIRLCEAGHPLPILVLASGPARTIGTGGFPVGLLPGSTYESDEFAVEPGDRLYLYSDGITECMNSMDEQFGDDRLLEYLEETRKMAIREVLHGLEHQIADWNGGHDLEDDVSMLALDVLHDGIGGAVSD
jgi:sigma-B regulation protein RsbU (phosphoserine phosphatase)